jgi:hypothetical protein
MTTTAVAERPADNPAAVMEQVVIGGDLSRLTSQQRVLYYRQVCESVGLNPLTRPFDYLVLNGKLTLYANRGASDQLRRLRAISIEKVEREELGGLFVVTVYGKDKAGRVDTAIGAVPIEGLKGEAKANAMMKAETKAKRRLTLSLAGLGWLDESEVDTIPDARHVQVDGETGEILGETPAQLGTGAPEGELEPLSTTAAARLPAIPKGIRTITSLGTGDVTGYVKLKDSGPSDGQLRQTDEGHRVGFVLELASGQRIAQVDVRDDLAEALYGLYEDDLRRFVDTEVNLTGELFGVPWKNKDGEAMPPFYRLKVTALRTREWSLPAEAAPDPDATEAEPAAEPEKPKRASRAKARPAPEADEASDAAQPEPHGDAARDVVDQAQQAAPTGPRISREDFNAQVKAQRIAAAYLESAARAMFGTADLDALDEQQLHRLAEEAGLFDQP